MRKFAFALFTAITALAAVENATSAPPTVMAQSTSPGVCRNPRPQVCFYLWLPVCGIAQDGTRQTYSNPCTACQNRSVVRHTPGPCPDA